MGTLPNIDTSLYCRTTLCMMLREGIIIAIPQPGSYEHAFTVHKVMLEGDPDYGRYRVFNQYNKSFIFDSPDEAIHSFLMQLDEPKGPIKLGIPWPTERDIKHFFPAKIIYTEID